jgi:ADP-ribose pyrophosphatase
MRKVEIIEERTVYDGWMKVIRARLRQEKLDGSMSEGHPYEKMERGDAVAALIWNRDTGKIILINQFRYPACKHGSGWITEVVAGKVEEGEEPQETVKRELIEESGYQVETLEHIGDFYVSPGGTTERIFLYYAEVRNIDKIAKGGGLKRESEDIQVLEYSWEEVMKMLDNGEFEDAKTIIALMWLKNKRNARGEEK